MHFLKRTRGFSLIEILIVLAIATILLSISLPSFRQFYYQAKSQTVLEKLTRALKIARQEAIVQHSVIEICKSNDQETCSGNWQDGFIVHDSRHVFYAFLSPHQEGKLYWRAFPFRSESLQFLPSGTTHYQNGTFWYCFDSVLNPVWAVTISQAGRFRVIYPDGTHTIHDDKEQVLIC